MKNELKSINEISSLVSQLENESAGLTMQISHLQIEFINKSKMVEEFNSNSESDEPCLDKLEEAQHDLDLLKAEIGDVQTKLDAIDLMIEQTISQLEGFENLEEQNISIMASAITRDKYGDFSSVLTNNLSGSKELRLKFLDYIERLKHLRKEISETHEQLNQIISEKKEHYQNQGNAWKFVRNITAASGAVLALSLAFGTATALVIGGLAISALAVTGTFGNGETHNNEITESGVFHNTGAKINHIDTNRWNKPEGTRKNTLEDMTTEIPLRSDNELRMSENYQHINHPKTSYNPNLHSSAYLFNGIEDKCTMKVNPIPLHSSYPINPSYYDGAYSPNDRIKEHAKGIYSNLEPLYRNACIDPVGQSIDEAVKTQYAGHGWIDPLEKDKMKEDIMYEDIMNPKTIPLQSFNSYNSISSPFKGLNSLSTPIQYSSTFSYF